VKFQVHLENFEGPLDLLLHLIKKNKLDICHISISRVTDEYLAAIDEMKHLNLEIAGEFLVMAATLIHIKSRMLLPEMGAADEEENEEADPGENLVMRLKEYEFFKQAAASLGESHLLGRDLFVSPVRHFEEQADDVWDYAEVGLFELMRVCRELWHQGEPESCHQVEVETLSVARRVEEICLFLGLGEAVDVRRFFPERPTHYQLIVTLLAILELVRVRQIRLVQKFQFGPIEVTRLR
jgi:segregation and condensation protein A